MDTNMHSIAAVLDAAVAAVPPAVLQAAVLAPEEPLVAAWSRHMLCDILTDKVCRALRQLYLAGKLSQDEQPVCFASDACMLVMLLALMPRSRRQDALAACTVLPVRRITGDTTAYGLVHA